MTRHEPLVRTAVLPRHRPSGSVAPSAAATLSMQAQRGAISTTRTQVPLGSGRLKTLIAPCPATGGRHASGPKQKYP